jgi:hypothetical protein
LDKFNETTLLAKEYFFNKLTEEHISDEDYDRAQKVWIEFNCKTFKDYHDHYLLTDVLLLADCTESFHNTCLETYKLDPIMYYTLPGYSWDAILKHTGVELQLITDLDMETFISSSIRGGISVISHRHVVANNPYLDDYDVTSEPSYIVHLEVNNLYGWAMSQSLPFANFKFLSDYEVRDLDYMNVPDDLNMGYIVEVDLHYPTHLHSLHNDYPLAPEYVLVTESMLSPFCLSFGQKYVECAKLIPNLHDKSKYVLHYRNLKLYVQLGLEVTKVHRVLSFAHLPWMKEYTDLNTKL